MKRNGKNIGRILGTFLLGWIFTLYTLSAQVSLPDLVICMGTDGHLALESQESWFHCELIQEISHKTILHGLEKHTTLSADCLDIPLYQGNTSQFLLSQTKHVWKVDKGSFGGLNVQLQRYPTNICCRKSDHHISDPIIQTVETTVLLI